MEEEAYEDAEASASSCERTLFLERDEVLDLLGALADSANENMDAAARTKLFERVQTILEKYQEQSNLLDPHLESMMAVVMNRVREMTAAREAAAVEAKASGAGFPYQVYRSAQLHSLLAVVYQLCRVRGYKTIVKLLPHEVCDLEPVLHLLQSQDRNDAPTWESRYSLLLWLAMLCMVPFDISTIDSTLGASSGSSSGSSSSSGTLVGSIVALCTQYLSDAAVTRQAAAVCLASLLTRPDMEHTHLDAFVQWTAAVLQARAQSASADELTARTFEVSGAMATLAAVFKKGERGTLVAAAKVVLGPLCAVAAQSSHDTLLKKMVVKLFQRIGLAFLPPRVVAWRYQRGQRSLLQNLSASTATGSGDTGDSSSAAVAAAAAQESSTLEHCTEQSDDDDGDVPEELEEVVEQLLCGLRDRDTVVRWSAAKGVGRVTSRLSSHALADDVVGSVLDLFSEAESDAGWHGGCLALAELARRGLLLPSRLPATVPVVVRALAYDVRRAHGGVGAHVRDAACYVCWAFARAYSPEVLRPHVQALCAGMLTAALFDREINVRRAAAAAFQENVGRQGHENMAHGIEILTAADYFSLGSRTAAYLTIAPYVASFAPHRAPLIDAVRTAKLAHWDSDIRALAAKSLGALAPLDLNRTVSVLLPDCLAAVLSPDLLKRHGACLAAGELLLAVAKSGSSSSSSSSETSPNSSAQQQGVALLPPQLAAAVTDAIPALEKARLYRGRGGEVMRTAACKLAESIGAALPLTAKARARLLDTADECLKHPSDEVQRAAAGASQALLRSAFRGPAITSAQTAATAPPQPRKQELAALTARAVTKHSTGLAADDIASATRGHALALGALPRELAAPNSAALTALLTGLADACKPSATVGGEGDAETRRNAIAALADVCEEVGIGSNSSSSSSDSSNGESPTVKLQLEQVELVFAALLAATHDYSTDKRGDVGSWCRAAALTALERVTVLAVTASIGIPLDRPATAAAGAPLLAPPLSERLRYLKIIMPDEGAAAAAATAVGMASNAAANVAAATWGEVYFTPMLCEALMCALLKQLSEKLDAVRDVAGGVLQRLLCARLPTLPYVPCRRALVAALQLDTAATAAATTAPTAGGAAAAGDSDAAVGAAAVNWATPSVTFPMVVQALSLPPYHAAVASGLVISVGGLTESVVKHSAAALLSWARAAGGGSSSGSSSTSSSRRAVPADVSALATLGASLTALLTAHGGDDRVALPLLRTLDLLLANDAFAPLPAGHPFAGQLLTAVRTELRSCRAVQKICAGGGVLLGLIGFSGGAGAGALRSAVGLLAHKFPRVRKHVAELMYVRLLAAGDEEEQSSAAAAAAVVKPSAAAVTVPGGPAHAAEDKEALQPAPTFTAEAIDDALDLLTGAVWDGTQEEAKTARDAIAGVLGVELPAASSRRSSTSSKQAAGAKDELESYEALVRDAGY